MVLCLELRLSLTLRIQIGFAAVRYQIAKLLVKEGEILRRMRPRSAEGRGVGKLRMQTLPAEGAVVRKRCAAAVFGAGRGIVLREESLQLFLINDATSSLISQHFDILPEGQAAVSSVYWQWPFRPMLDFEYGFLKKECLRIR